MATNDTPPEEKKPASGSEPDEPEHRKPRRHGYRGYPNNPDIGGAVHAGTGLGGVGSTERGSGAPRESSIISEKTRESVEELGEEEESE